jgi:hypothetical protein
MVDRIYNFLSIKQILYGLMWVLVLIILLNPIGVPMGISTTTTAVYNYMGKLPQNPKLFVDIYYEPAAATEVQPQIGAIFRQIIGMAPKIVFVSTTNTGPIMFEKLKAYVPDVFAQLKYGDDYVYLGYLTGGETAAAALAKGIKEAVAKDNYGQSTASMPIFNIADKATDFNLMVLVTSGTDPVEYYVRQWNTPFKVPLLFCVLSVIAPSVQPFVSSGQAIGMLSGQKAAAEYELLIKKPASAVAAMDAQSVTHVLIIIFIVLGNALYWSMRLSNKGRKAK